MIKDCLDDPYFGDDYIGGLIWAQRHSEHTALLTILRTKHLDGIKNLHQYLLTGKKVGNKFILTVHLDMEIDKTEKTKGLTIGEVATKPIWRTD